MPTARASIDVAIANTIIVDNVKELSTSSSPLTAYLIIFNPMTANKPNAIQ